MNLQAKRSSVFTMGAHDKIIRVPGFYYICVFVHSYHVRRVNVTIERPSCIEVNEAGVFFVLHFFVRVTGVDLFILEGRNIADRIERRKEPIYYDRIRCPLDYFCISHCLTEANSNVCSLLDVRMEDHFIFNRVIVRLNKAPIFWRFKERRHFWLLLWLLLKLLIQLLFFW